MDSEFGRTTDPVRMYMREMGTVLLTREGEIEIAKRIEGGLMAMMLAIARRRPRSPSISDRRSRKSATAGQKINEVVDGWTSSRGGRRPSPTTPTSTTRDDDDGGAAAGRDEAE